MSPKGRLLKENIMAYPNVALIEKLICTCKRRPYPLGDIWAHTIVGIGSKPSLKNRQKKFMRLHCGVLEVGERSSLITALKGIYPWVIFYQNFMR